MESEKVDRVELLEKVLHIARDQQRLLAQNRLTELAESILARDVIISDTSKLKALKEQRAVEQSIIDEILTYDSDLRVCMEGALDDTRKELEKILYCTRAHRAYTSTPVNRES